MKRALTTAVVLLFAGGAAAGVFLFMRSVETRATAGGTTVDVIVANRDVPAGQELDPLIDDGVFRSKAIDGEDLLPGVVTDLYQLQGQRTAYPILAEEQIAAARLAGPLQAGGGILGIPEGYQAASISLESQRVVAGVVRQGDHVEVFGTFSAAQGNASQTTRVVVEDALVLAVEVPEGATTGTGPGAAIATLAVTPEQAARLIFAQEQGHVWLTLLPPNEVGVAVPPVSLRSLR